jgi:hypothetical protein
MRKIAIFLLALLCAGCSSKVVADVEASPAALVASVAALLAFLSGVLGPFVQWRIGLRTAAASQTSANASMLAARTTGAREIAKLRMSWMETLRNTLAEYHSILMSTEDANGPDARKLSELGTQLDLLLNQNDKLQKELWDITDRIYELKKLSERQALDKPLMEAGRVVLKAEWEKVKIEMAGGDFQTGQ